jgi:hypothetical protein
MSFVAFNCTHASARPAHGHRAAARHHVVQQEPQTMEETSEDTPEGSTTPPEDAQSQETQSQDSTDQAQQESTEQQSGSESSAYSGKSEKSTFRNIDALKNIGVNTAEIIFFVILYSMILGGGSLMSGLFICAIVWHVGKLFRGGRKPAIG